ncbi:Flavin prenyltransferase UbiX [Planctomycetales bacterium 10988]|nr:Flavin prenyltransferase UbiX [Planctomycetales bacterium 10988]
MQSSYVLGITGASGAVYCIRLLQVLLETGRKVHITISPSGQAVMQHEMGLRCDLENFDPESLFGRHCLTEQKYRVLQKAAGLDHWEETKVPAVNNLHYHHYKDFMCPIASGSYLTEGMVICPCSGATVSAIAHGASTNLIHRAADVHLKERRPLILVPRETPLSMIQLDNMHRCTQAGAVMLPAMPGFYHEPLTIKDLVDFVVARICDQLGIRNALVKRWGEPDSIKTFNQES